MSIETKRAGKEKRAAVATTGAVEPGRPEDGGGRAEQLAAGAEPLPGQEAAGAAGAALVNVIRRLRRGRWVLTDVYHR